MANRGRPRKYNPDDSLIADQGQQDQPQPQDKPQQGPLLVLDGLSSPALTLPVRVGQETEHPMNSTYYPAVAEIVRMTDGEPDPDGSDVTIYFADKTKIVLVNTPIVFSYKIDPLEKPLTTEELKFSVQIAWSVEQGTTPDARGKAQHDEAMARAKRHGQMDDIEAALGRLRAAKAKYEADARLAGLAGLDEEDEDVTDEELAASTPADLDLSAR